MKIYFITIDDVYDYCETNHRPILVTTAKERNETIKKLKTQAVKDTPNWKLENHKSSPGFSLYLDGEYSCNHYNVNSYEYELDIIKK